MLSRMRLMLSTRRLNELMAADKEEIISEYTYISHLLLEPSRCKYGMPSRELVAECFNRRESAFFAALGRKERYSNCFADKQKYNDIVVDYCYSNSGEPSSTGSAYHVRHVYVILICGTSGSGKSTLARELTDYLHFPFEPIQSDWFQRRHEDLTPCPHTVPAGVVPWSRTHCTDSELPGSQDLSRLCNVLREIIHALSTAPNGPQPAIAIHRPRGVYHLQQRWETFNERQVHLIVEGYSVFAEPALLGLSEWQIWLHIGSDTAATRR